MIARVAGMLLEKRNDAAIVDVGGLGYLVHLSQQSLAALGPAGSAVALRTYTHVREDALQLYGFVTEDEERLFGMLIDVSGVGPKLAINILSGMAAKELAKALVGGEFARLTKIPGVGKKTAERLVVELKDKLKTSGLLTANEATTVARTERTAEAARRALGAKATLEEQLREALKLLTGAA